jgi:hypothetical protein
LATAAFSGGSGEGIHRSLSLIAYEVKRMNYLSSNLKLYLLYATLGAVPICAQGLPALIKSPAECVGDKARSSCGSPHTPVPPGDYVRVSTTGTLGPMGYIVTPSVSSATQLAVNPEAVLASQNYNFPSIILYISAMPVVYPEPDQDTGKVDSKTATANVNKEETKQYPTWLDATFTLEPQNDQGQVIKGACESGAVRVLGILPQQTVATTQASIPDQVATAINSVAGALASFYPGVKSQVSGATSALNVLFQAIFPPKSVAYQYSYLDGNCRFGWYFRPNTSGAGTEGVASILGIQTGIVMLQTDKSIAAIQVKSQTLSEWSENATVNSKIHYGKQRALPTFVLPQKKDIDYTQISSLSSFPLLIPKDQALSILQMKTMDDPTWIAFAKGTTPSLFLVGTAVTNSSLSAYLGIPPPK